MLKENFAYRFQTFQCMLALLTVAAYSQVSVKGTPQKWQPMVIELSGPQADENGNSPNPFFDFRFNVIFTSPSGKTFDIPGFFDGDGNGGGSGNVWRCRFLPDETGTWQYKTSFRQGANVAINTSATGGSAVSAYASKTGSFSVGPAPANAQGMYKKGRILYTGKFYLQHQDGDYFLKGGCDSPENFFGFKGFDNTPYGRLNFSAHSGDWKQGDPDWGGGKGKPIIGAINYLTSLDVNSVYIMTNNVGGDAKDSYPFINIPTKTGGAGNDYKHYDVSKLAQWYIVMDHAQRKGMYLHVVLGEGEEANKKTLDNATLGNTRKVYYRELVARFGCFPGLQWNVCEEYDIYFKIPVAEIKKWGQYIKDIDPYDHPRCVHNTARPGDEYKEFIKPGSPFTTTAMQVSVARNKPQDVAMDELCATWRSYAEGFGRPIPINVDETKPERITLFWPLFLGGGAGTEIYIGGNDQSLDSFRVHEDLYKEMGYARMFVQNNMPFWEMKSANDALQGESGDNASVFARQGEWYAVYFRSATSTGSLNLPSGNYELQWYNPRTGAFADSKTDLAGGGAVNLPSPPSDASLDWACLIRETGATDPVKNIYKSGYTAGNNRSQDDITKAYSITGKLLPSTSYQSRLVNGIFIMKKGGIPQLRTILE